MESKYQLWGTFSVKDHVKAGAFIAEVLMYDRLVIPIPPQRDADDKEKTKEAEEEWERWKIEKMGLWTTETTLDHPWGPCRSS